MNATSKIQLIYTSIFGVFGVLTRYYIGILSTKYLSLDFPIATFTINLLGSFLIGAVYSLGIERNLMSPELTLALMTGFLGGFTTFSAFSLETVRLFEQHFLTMALLYISGSFLGGILSAAAGLHLARLLFTLK